MVALAAEVSSLEVCQGVKGVDIIEIRPLLLKAEPVGKQRLQLLLHRLQHQRDGRGHLIFPCILQNGFNDRSNVPSSKGIEIGELLKTAAYNPKVAHPADFGLVYMAPVEQRRKAVLAAVVIGPAQQLLHPSFILQANFVKIQTNVPFLFLFLCFYFSIMTVKRCLSFYCCPSCCRYGSTFSQIICEICSIGSGFSPSQHSMTCQSNRFAAYSAASRQDIR